MAARTGTVKRQRKILERDRPQSAGGQAYVFLASPQCSGYITGEILPIIGGY